jgi:hypothetical protein
MSNPHVEVPRFDAACFKRPVDVQTMQRHGASMLRKIPPADADEVMQEQFEFLMEHAIRSRREPEICAGGQGESCRVCTRYYRIKAILMQPFNRLAKAA